MPIHPLLQRAHREIESATRHLTPQQLAAAPAGKWSAAAILEHLTLAFRVNAQALERALAAGTPKGRPPRPLEALARTLVVNVGYFPRVKAPEGVVPSGSVPAERAPEALLDALAALDAALTRAADRFGDRARVVNHPFFAGLTVPQWRRFHWLHVRHHMRQVKKRTRYTAVGESPRRDSGGR